MIRKIIKFVERPFIEILLIFVITCFAFVVYVTYQQASRMGANEPQRSIVMDIAADLQNGKNLKDYTAGYIDISNNMAPFVIIYDKYGKVVAGNGYLDNAVPQVPIGVLATSDNHKENSVTWCACGPLLEALCEGRRARRDHGEKGDGEALVASKHWCQGTGDAFVRRKRAGTSCKTPQNCHKSVNQ